MYLRRYIQNGFIQLGSHDLLTADIVEKYPTGKSFGILVAALAPRDIDDTQQAQRRWKVNIRNLSVLVE